MTLKVKYADFQTITRSRTTSTPISRLDDLEAIAQSLLEPLFPTPREFEHLKTKIRFPEGRPNIEAREDIEITDAAPIAQTVEGERDAG